MDKSPLASPLHPTMPPSLRVIAFLCGNKQASLIGPGDIAPGDAIVLFPQNNPQHSYAVCTSDARGDHLGRIARKKAKGMRRLLATAARLDILYDARFLRFFNEERESKFSSTKTYISVNLEIEIRFFDADTAAIREAISHVVLVFDFEIEAVEEEEEEDVDVDVDVEEEEEKESAEESKDEEIEDESEDGDEDEEEGDEFRCGICSDCGNFWNNHDVDCGCEDRMDAMEDSDEEEDSDKEEDSNEEDDSDGFWAGICHVCGNYWDNQGGECTCDI